ncbi:hypothetical protein KAV47_06900, partial [Candidatus Bathyarchaeota archaeon]|nr:hypothetical protein [Candidatus Bathyarchaeota archaeon]
MRSWDQLMMSGEATIKELLKRNSRIILAVLLLPAIGMIIAMVLKSLTSITGRAKSLSCIPEGTFTVILNSRTSPICPLSMKITVSKILGIIPK